MRESPGEDAGLRRSHDGVVLGVPDPDGYRSRERHPQGRWSSAQIRIAHLLPGGRRGVHGGRDLGRWDAETNALPLWWLLT